jgi:hypothetical protein
LAKIVLNPARCRFAVALSQSSFVVSLTQTPRNSAARVGRGTGTGSGGGGGFGGLVTYVGCETVHEPNNKMTP